MSNSANKAAKTGSVSFIRWPDLTLRSINLHSAYILDVYQRGRQSKPKRHS